MSVICRGVVDFKAWGWAPGRTIVAAEESGLPYLLPIGSCMGTADLAVLCWCLLNFIGEGGVIWGSAVH